MKRKKKKKNTGLWQKYRWYIIGLFSTVLIYHLLTGNYGLIKYYELTREKEQLEIRIKKARMEIDSLKTITRQLENDPKYIEKIAREKYNMVKNGETVYQMVPADK